MGQICQYHEPDLIVSYNNNPNNNLNKQPISLIEEEGGFFNDDLIDVWERSTNIKAKYTDKVKIELNRIFQDKFEANMDQWQHYCKLIASSDFLMGKVNKFKAWLIWAIKPDNIDNVMAGGYGVTEKEKNVSNDIEEPNIINSDTEHTEFNLASIPNLQQKDLQRVMKKNILTREQIQSSIYNFSHDYKKKLYKTIKDPVAYIMSLLLKATEYKSNDKYYKEPKMKLKQIEKYIEQDIEDTANMSKDVGRYYKIARDLGIENIIIYMAIDVLNYAKSPVKDSDYEDTLDYESERFTEELENKLDISVDIKTIFQKSNLSARILHRSLEGLLSDLQKLSKEQGREVVSTAANNLLHNIPYISYSYHDEYYHQAQTILSEMKILLEENYKDQYNKYIDQKYNIWKQEQMADMDKFKELLKKEVPACELMYNGNILRELRLREYYIQKILSY